MSKRSLLTLVGAFVAAVLITAFADRRPFEELAERVTIAEQASAPGAKCPLSRQYINESDLNLLRVCLKYGLGAYDAAQRYPHSAEKVFAVYGEDPTFQTVLDQYGHQVIPVVAYFVENGSFELQARQALGEILQQLWSGQRPNWTAAKLTREQIGLIAIDEIAARGHEILAQFEIVDGIAKPKPITGFILEAKQFFLGGVGDLEKVLVRGERLPTWKEGGVAALDVTVVLGGVGAFAKVARVGREALVEKGALRLGIEGAYGTVSAVGRAGWGIAPYALLYVAVTRPMLILSLAGWVAEQLGFNPIVGIFAVSFVVILLALRLLTRLIRCGQVVGASFGLLRRLFAAQRGMTQSAKPNAQCYSL
jgi:hypothetical protein